MDGDAVRHDHLGAHLALRVMSKHDLDLDTDHTLPHHHVPHSLVDVVLLWLSCGNEVPILELHGLGTLCAELAADDDLAALCSILHDEADNAVGGAANGQAAQELEAQGLALGHGAACAVLHALREELDAVLRETESLLHEGGQFPDATALLSEDLASAGGTDDDLRADRRDSDLDAGVAVLAQCAGQELVQLSIENTISHELALLGDLGTRVCHCC
mmetsp:Transcript_67951/g.109509  ORF Transcript_67951/g.109509 Transcript_67951/m.109509 type:complete len:217 (-) Transcript_67951:74-724(-)